MRYMMTYRVSKIHLAVLSVQGYAHNNIELITRKEENTKYFIILGLFSFSSFFHPSFLLSLVCFET